MIIQCVLPVAEKNILYYIEKTYISEWDESYSMSRKARSRKSSRLVFIFFFFFFFCLFVLFFSRHGKKFLLISGDSIII